VVNIDGKDHPIKGPEATKLDPAYAGLGVGSSSKGLYIYIEDVTVSLISTFPGKCRAYYLQAINAQGVFQLAENGYYTTCDYLLRDLRTSEPNLYMTSQDFSCADYWVTVQPPSFKQISPFPPLPNKVDGKLYWIELGQSSGWGAVALHSQGESALVAQTSRSQQILHYIESLSSDIFNSYYFGQGDKLVPSEMTGDRILGLYSAWSGIAASGDGSTLVAIQSAVYSLPGEIPRRYAGGYLYLSSDFGDTWVRQDGAGSGDWSGVACSSDGSFIVGVQQGDVITPFPAAYIWISNDGGKSWVQQGGAGI